MRSSNPTPSVLAFVARSPFHLLRTFTARRRELLILGMVALAVHVAFRGLSAGLDLRAGDDPRRDWITDYLGAFSLLTNSGVVGVIASWSTWTCQPAAGVYATKAPTELQQWLYAACGAKVMTLHVSMSLLRWGSSAAYFGMIRAIGDTVRTLPT